ncbi:hypothetical protein OG758_11025 [Streptomyces sp. NBC_01474]|uniref:hypothetical protein n=1 Tax=unclassified Streptomyces TaxID=2593676 RepID=UPI002DD93DB3|nr:MULTISPECIES: hypothetical protein [unclassified Streptomyces]WSD94632.1 hypothetical protein OG758_11025 [Streptomyces sp. NBC_01474]
MSDDDPRWSSAAPPVAGRPDLDRPARRRDHESHHADGVEDVDTTVHEGRAKGWTGSTGIVGAKVSASYDDGATWTPAKVDREHGGAFEVALRQPALDELFRCTWVSGRRSSRASWRLALKERRL